ncbi:MAG: TfoX/Sxy family protein [Rhodobiaceae bacterium]|nr:TfoX/Sxy family protein [Rhodobiaceae bacterium]
MALNREYAAYVEDLLSPVGGVRVRPMFGGGGVFCGDLMFGLIADDMLYLKADDAFADDFAAEGMAAFTYEAKGRTMSLSYWQVPERIGDDQDELVAWAVRALKVARDAAAARPARKRKSAK